MTRPSPCSQKHRSGFRFRELTFSRQYNLKLDYIVALSSPVLNAIYVQDLSDCFYLCEAAAL